MRNGRNFKNKVVSTILVIFLILLLKAFFDNFRRLNRALTVLREKESVVANLRLENDNIKKRIEELSSDLHIERQLRDDLGMAKEGETVVILPDDEELRKLVVGFNPDNDKTKLPVWRQWLEVFRF